MDILNELLKSCIPIIVGALIVLIPTSVDKYNDRKYNSKEQLLLNRREMYVQLISLFGKVLKGPYSSSDLDLLRDQINLINITGSSDVVKALNEYISTWGRSSGDEQNHKYSILLKTIRVDLGVDKKMNEKFPDIGLIDINIKNSNSQ